MTKLSNTRIEGVGDTPTTPRQYRKKPVVIDAIMYTPDNWHSCLKFGNGAVAVNGGETLVIRTLEGNMTVGHGDYIIKGVAGEFYPCKSDIFARTYEPVSAGVPQSTPSTTSNNLEDGGDLYPVCDCDGYWHVEIDGNTHYLDLDNIITNKEREARIELVERMLAGYEWGLKVESDLKEILAELSSGVPEEVHPTKQEDNGGSNE